MTITRGFAAGAMLAGLALVVTAPVSTADPLNGHYIETETYPDGHQVHSDWFITPCGDGCASIKEVGQANLVNGQWTLDGKGGVSCEEGGDVQRRDQLPLHVGSEHAGRHRADHQQRESLRQPAGLPGDQQPAPAAGALGVDHHAATGRA